MDFKFGQLSDLHLGKSFRGGLLSLPPEKAGKRIDEQRAALKRFVDEALKERWDAALLPGDLFDKERVDAANRNFLIEQLNRLAPIPAVITPGNHDPYSPLSVYNRENVHHFGGASQPEWGGHIRIITGRDFAAIDIGDARIVGGAFHEKAAISSAPLLKAKELRRDGAVNILVIHGTLTGPFAQDPEEDVTMPFDIEALRSLGFDYAAIGHYHSFQTLNDAAGRVIGAYSGAPIALNAADKAEHGFIRGNIRREDAGASTVEIELVRTDPRMLRRITVDITGLNNPDSFREKILAELGAAGQEDIVALTLEGRYPPGSPPRMPDEAEKRVFHLQWFDRSISDHGVDFGEAPPDEPPPKDAQEMFVRRMMQRYLDADEETRRVIVEATSYGLDAIKAGEVHLK